MISLKQASFLLTGILLLTACAEQPQRTQPATKDNLRQQLQTLISHYDATVGVSIVAVEDHDTLTINNGHHFPMQSTYKFPLALAVLHQVDEGKLQLDQEIFVTKAMLRPDTWSPLREKYPEGNVAVTVAELLDYSASQSDNNACDILFELVGGTKVTEEYIHGLGVTDMAIVATEKEMTAGWDVQYTNWVVPSAMTQLLERFLQQKDLSKTSNDFLMNLMINSPSAPNRLKGLLPEGTVVAHKTGTSDTNETGMTGAVNDIGIITLPNGKHLAIAVLVSNTQEDYETAQLLIAKITRAVYNHYTGKTGPARRQTEFTDESRKRQIPLAIYENLSANNKQVVILSGGYLSEHTRYSYIAHRLANRGYLVVSIQHDLPGDQPIAQEGKVYELRKPVWERGNATILYTIAQLKKHYPGRHFKKLILIGHSNGGDMSILLAKNHPELVSAVITLDHRRMPVQKTKAPRLLSLRASDFEADPGVLPTAGEQQQYGIRIMELGESAKHSDMDDRGSVQLKNRILEAIEAFLAE
jgi:beta-lactamase class A